MSIEYVLMYPYGNMKTLRFQLSPPADIHFNNLGYFRRRQAFASLPFFLAGSGDWKRPSANLFFDSSSKTIHLLSCGVLQEAGAVTRAARTRDSDPEHVPLPVENGNLLARRGNPLVKAEAHIQLLKGEPI
jgi:hypothetical protein